MVMNKEMNTLTNSSEGDFEVTDPVNNKDDVLSLEILENLTKGLDFVNPSLDIIKDLDIPETLLDALKNAPTSITNADLTELRLDGTGTFDVLMGAMTLQLDEQYKTHKITAQEYAKVYVASIANAMQFATQFLLQKDGAKWQAITAQLQAYKAAVDAQTAKAQLSLVTNQALTAKAQYASTVADLGIKDAQFALQVLQKDVVAKDLELKDMAITKAKVEIEVARAQLELLKEQIDSERSKTKDTTAEGDDIEGSAGRANVIAENQAKLVLEQANEHRGQTSDTRLDLQTITGIQKVQKDLYNQQITSYKRKDEANVATLYADAYKTAVASMGEISDVVSDFTGSGIQNVLKQARTNVGLV